MNRATCSPVGLVVVMFSSRYVPPLLVQGRSMLISNAKRLTISRRCRVQSLSSTKATFW